MGQHKIVSTKLQKILFFRQFKDHYSGGQHRNQTNDTILFAYLLCSIVTFIFAIDSSQNSFSYGPAFCPFWSVKYLNFGQKLLIWTSHHTFLESRHPEATQNPYLVYFPCFLYNPYFPYKSMFCSPRGARKRQQFMDYITSKGDITSKHLIKCMMLCESIFWVYT